MKQIILLLVMLPLFALGYNNPDSKTLMSEYKKLRSKVSTMKHDYLVGFYYKARDFGDTTLMWNLEDDITDHEVIRLFRRKADGKVFAVTYHRSVDIVPGRIVLRRFVGGEPTGWINHTFDYHTGENFGQQGFWPNFDESDHAFMKEWSLFY